MKTSISEHILNSIKYVQRRALPDSAMSFQPGIALLIVMSLCWSLFIPLGALAKTSKSKLTTSRSVPVLQSTQTFNVYGPQRFDRHTGQPVNVVQSFSIPVEAVAPFTILVQNGATDGSGRVSSATIRLNGADVFTPNSFNQSVNSLTKSVSLVATNTLEVKLASATGSYLSVTFTATRQALPATLVSVAPARATQGQTLNVTLHGSNTQWIAGQTRAALGGEVAVGGASFGELGPVTVVDSTTAVAGVTVSPTAALDPRSVRVVTPAHGVQAEESVTLPDGFVVDALTPPGASSSNVSTIAGGAGAEGFVDGSGSVARFRKLTGIAIGSDDAIYLADSGNQRVRVVRSQTGTGGALVWTVTTLAGDGTAGFADGPGSSAQFNNPQGVAVDASGIVYVADTANNRVRRIASDGTVSTLAGDGTAGFQDGPGSQARFNAPQGIAADNLGNIYVADTGNSSLRAINAAGEVRTVAGDGTIGSNNSPNARFDGLVGVAIDGSNIYVYLSDTGNHRIRRLDPTGIVITVTGAERGFSDGSVSQARFAEPSGIAIDGNGKIIIADAINSLVRLVDPDLAASGSNQAVVTLAGTGSRGLTNGTGDVARFFTPRGIAVSRSSAIIVADTGNQVLRRILLPPVIHAITPPSARLSETITITGEHFDGRGPERNVVRFTRSQPAGGGQTFGSVTQATRTALTVVVPADAATGPVTVQTEGGTATSPSDFVVDQFSAPAITDFNPKRGTPGTQVTLTGTNLKVNANDPTVTFAGSNGTRLPALVNSASATEVHTTVPNGAITGVIQLTHVGGTAATATPFTVDSEQEFQLTVAPSTTTAVQGGSGTYVVYVTSAQSTFSQLAQLTATGLPAGITATFDPAQITAGASSTLTLKLSGTIASGSYPLTIRGVASVGGHDVEHTAGATLNVMTSGQTTLSGRVLSTEKEPIIGATASLDGHTAMTDAAGSFLLSGVTAGPNRPLMIDGRTASSPNRTYPVIIEPANLVAGQANVNPYTFYLPPIDTQYEVEVVPGQNTVASNPRVPGLQMTIPAGANLRNRDGSPITRVSITPLAIDRTPAPLPANIRTGLVYTSQPGGALSDVPMPVIYPNLLGVNPGTRVELYAFNHDTVQWYIYGYGRVSTDGRTIAPEIDPSTGRQYGLRDFSWHMPNAGPSGDGGGGGKGCDSCPCSRGPKPVDYSTGIKFETVTDLSFGGTRGGITLSRYYSSDNSAQAILGRFGRGWKDSYDFLVTGTWTVGGAGRVISPDEQTGRLFSYTRTDTDGALVFSTTATVSQLGDVVRKLTDGTLEYRYASGAIMRFNTSGRLTAIVDRNGNVTSLSYTGSNLTQITDPVGRTVTLNYDSSNRVNKLTDPLAREWRYTYDSSIAFGILATVTDPLGGVTTYRYTNLRLSSITDPRDNFAKRITYDSAGRVISQQFADGGTEQYDYTLSGGLVTSTTITDPMGRKTTRRFNANGYVLNTIDELGQNAQIARDLTTNLATATVGPCGCAEATRQFDQRGNVTSATDQLGHTTSYEFEPVFNNVTKITDKNGEITTFSYDSRGNLMAFTNPLGETSTFDINAYGQTIAVTDALGHQTHMEYDPNGTMSARVDPLGHRWVMEHDTVGRLTASANPLGQRIVTEYDGLDRVKKVTDPSGGATRYVYDQNSNQTRMTDALNHDWTMQYDSKNRLTSQTDPLGRIRRIGYNSDDEKVQVISPSGRKTLYTYDSRGQRSRSTSPLGEVVKFEYDSRGNLVRLTDPRGNTTAWTYDERFRPVTVRDPLGKTTSVEYDAQGNLKKMVDKLGRQTSVSYDSLNRVVQIVYQDAQVTYDYDRAGRIKTITDSQDGPIAYAYDNASRRTSETTPRGVVSYEYNDANQHSKMTAGERPPVTYGYDPAGRLQLITQGTETFSFDYDALSRRKSLTRPNGVMTNYDYDEANRLKRLTHATGPQVIEDNQYTYTMDDEISSVTSLASATVLPQQKTANTADTANRVSQIGAVSYSFDDLGQMIARTDSQGTTQFGWDARGRLRQANLPNGQTLSYSYDALGRRTSRTANSITTSFLYDGQDVVLDRSSDGSTVDYLNGANIDEKLRQTSSNGGSLYFLQDHLSSVQALTDGAGNTVERKNYEAFGASANASLTRYGFTGREREDATGMIYYRARWYDPQQARFISEDPIGFNAGMNWYAYVENEPIASNDPSGLNPLPRSRTGTRPCRPDEMAACVAMCGAKGVQSCRVSQTFRLVRQRDGKALWKWADGPLSCSCNDCEPEKEREPQKARHPLNQPTMDELRMRQESAEQMYEFWKKVTIGGYLVGVVLTGGALLGGGAGAGALLPAFAP